MKSLCSIALLLWVWLCRLSAATIVDPSFRPELNANPEVVLPLPDGRVYVAGRNLVFNIGGRTQLGITRLNRDGSVDSSFNAGAGIELLTLSPSQLFRRLDSLSLGSVALVLQPDGRIVVFVGVLYSARLSAFRYEFSDRFNADGSRDASFQPAAGLRDSPSLPLILADGRWLTAEPSTDATGLRNVHLARFNPNGSADPSFGEQTLVAPPGALGGYQQDAYYTTDPYNRIGHRATDSQGRIYLGTHIHFKRYQPSFGRALDAPGDTNPRAVLFRLNPDGTQDRSFSVPVLNDLSALHATDQGLIFAEHVWTVVPSTDPGATSVVGNTTARSGVTIVKRLNYDGAVDTEFQQNVTPYYQVIHRIAVAENSTYLLRNGQQGRRGILKLGTNGARDPDFSAELGEAASTVAALYAGENGQLFVSGTTLSVGGEGSRYLVRLIADTESGATHLANLSVRARAGTGGNTLVAGVITRGGASPLLVRGVGPSLAPFNVFDWLPDPQVGFYNGAALYAFNDDWASSASPSLAEASLQVRAFGFPNSTKDSAMLISTPSGSHTLHLSGKDSSSGIALLELYATEKPKGALSSRITNFSGRAHAGTGPDTLVLGFTIDGPGNRSILLRVVGAGLAGFGIAGALPDPKLTLLCNGFEIGTNNDWGTASPATVMLCREATTAVGAFPLNAGSKDAALVATLAAGIYTVQVEGMGSATGIALVEIYEIP